MHTGDVVREVTLNGTSLDPAIYDAEKGRLPLPGLATENEMRVVADCTYSRSGEGLHRFVDPVDQSVYLYTQFETADAHRMYTCFDQPDLKATFELSVWAPEGWQVVTNEAAGSSEGGRWRFPPTSRGRDGERGLRDLSRVSDLPVAGHRRPLSGAG